MRKNRRLHTTKKGRPARRRGIWLNLMSVVMLTALVCRVDGSCLVEARGSERHAVHEMPHTLVAIGDSITFGYNLGNNQQPSPLAYPTLVASRLHWQTVNLGVPGWTSADVLRHLNTSQFRAALRQANLVVVDIGSNDLLQAARSLLQRYRTSAASGRDSSFTVTSADQTQLTLAVQQFAQNDAAIITQIRKQSTAPIVLVNLYDPFPDSNPLHNATESAISAANQVVITAAAESQSLFADVYLAFNHHQMRYVQVATLDIHPTVSGQMVIANQVNAAIDRPLWHSPNEYATAPSGVLVRSQPGVTSDAIAWLHGIQGALVTGVSGGWYKVVTPGSLTGYVPAKSVGLLLRPWNDVSFKTATSSVTALEWQVAPRGTNRSNAKLRVLPGFIWHGVAYAPVAPLVAQAQYSAVWHNAIRDVNILEAQTNPAQSGRGIGRVTASRAALPGWSTLTAVQTGATRQVTLTTSGIAVSMNGEFIRLNGQAVTVNGQIYAPVEAVWEAIGGSVGRLHPVSAGTGARRVNSRGIPVLRLIGPGGS